MLVSGPVLYRVDEEEPLEALRGKAWQGRQEQEKWEGGAGARWAALWETEKAVGPCCSPTNSSLAFLCVPSTPCPCPSASDHRLYPLEPADK